MIVFLTKWDFISIKVIVILSARGLIYEYMQRSLSHLIKPVSFVYCLIMLNSLSPYLIIFYQKLSGDSSLSTNEQTRDWNEMQGKQYGELDDTKILLPFYDNINRV